METTLHRQLKALYADDQSQQEVPLDNYRIDVVRGGVLVEIQLGAIGAIRDKLRKLLENHKVLVVKPIIVRKHLVKLDGPDGSLVSRRRSPKRGNLMTLFDELVYCTRLFPHPNLCIDVPLIEMEEFRFPGHGRRRRHRDNDFQIQDQSLLSVESIERFATAADLANLVPKTLPKTFHTGHLAEAIGQSRKKAQQVAYCFRHMKITKQVGKEGNAILYRFRSPRDRKRRKRSRRMSAIPLPSLPTGPLPTGPLPPASLPSTNANA
ncbi:MAG: hypothetical protein GY917_23595 [Planctomycetaceae bacterium]|nr:hypothetical protein [Planctomycetaceae bacterium]